MLLDWEFGTVRDVRQVEKAEYILGENVNPRKKREMLSKMASRFEQEEMV
jgi:hypothetical protein